MVVTPVGVTKRLTLRGDPRGAAGVLLTLPYDRSIKFTRREHRSSIDEFGLLIVAFAQQERIQALRFDTQERVSTSIQDGTLDGFYIRDTCQLDRMSMLDLKRVFDDDLGEIRDARIWHWTSRKALSGSISMR
jgi:hypothetical protein